MTMKKLLIVPLILAAGSAAAHDSCLESDIGYRLDEIQSQMRDESIWRQVEANRAEQQRLYDQADRDWQYMQIQSDNFLRSKNGK